MFWRFFCVFFSLLAVTFSSVADSLPSPPPRVGRALVVANAADPASLELARLYMRSRQLPPANLLRLSFSSPIDISDKDFQVRLLAPLQERLTRLGDAVDYLVFMRGVPYRVGGKISLPTAAMYNGAENIRPVNPYYRAETPFNHTAYPSNPPFRLAAMVTGYTFDDTERLIKASRVTYPSAAAAGTFYLCEGVGPRGMRAPQIDQTLNLLPRYQARGERVKGADIRDRLDVLGQFTGAPRLKLEGNRYLPGAIVDNVTSFGGYLLDPKGQMSILSFIQHGACGAYGTVHEPTNSLTRWADLTLPVRYASGFNLAESYYQTVADWRFGVLVGDPLMAPFARPVSIQLDVANQTISVGDKVSIDVTLREGVKGGGVGRTEFWLDDQVKLLDWLPSLPVGSQCALEIKAGDQTLVEKRVTIAEEPEPLTNVLEAFTGNVGQAGRIIRQGARGDHLSLVMMPLIDSDGNMVPVSYAFTVKNSGEEAITKGTLAQRLVMSKAMVLDFGDSPPVPGDKVTVTVGGHTRSAQAFSTSTMDDVLKQLITYLAVLPPFRPEGDYILNIRKSPVKPPRYQLVAFPKKTASGKEFPVSVRIRRSPGSMFARGLETAPRYWQIIPVGGFSQTTLTPRLPISQASFTLDIPPERLCAGAHHVTAVTTSSTGAETVSVATVTVLPEKDEMFSARMPTTTYHVGQTLMVTMTHPPSLSGSWPQLVVDGRVVCAWAPGTLVGELVLDGALMWPGEHRVWVEWSAGKELCEVTEVRAVLARSAAVDIYVRRPLASGARLSPEVVKAGTKRVYLTGPYLGGDVRVMTERDSLPVSRDSSDPGRWAVDISRLHPGAHTLSILGNPRTDQSGVILTPLVIQWRDAEQR
ncbi:MAG: TIGR03790 family protein [Lentisphaeria bacterium]|nr:TIGR03790 family protein [Lentisphaeria bacterium]